jgi:hypothetical protein
MPHNTDVLGFEEAAYLVVKGMIQYTAICIALLAIVYLTIGFGTWSGSAYV